MKLQLCLCSVVLHHYIEDLASLVIDPSSSISLEISRLHLDSKKRFENSHFKVEVVEM